MSSTDCLSRYRRNPSSSSSTPDRERLERGVAVEVLTEVIHSRKRAQGVTVAPSTFPSATEYFAACMSVLDVGSASQGNTRERVNFLFLLTAVLPQVPAPVLRRKSDECFKILLKLLNAAKGIKDPALGALYTRYSLTCIATVLKSLEARKVTWARPVVLKAFHAMLGCLAHSKPKIRKVAQVAVVEQLEHVKGLQGPHRLVVDVCLEVMKSCSVTDSTQTMQLLSFLKSALPVLNQGVSKLLLQVLRLAQLGHNDLTLYSLMTLRSYYAAEKVDLDVRVMAQHVHALKEMSGTHAKLITRDVQICKYWCEALQHAFIHAYNRGGGAAERCNQLLSEVVSTLVRLASSCEEPSFVVFPAGLLVLLVKDCVKSKEQAELVFKQLDPLLVPSMQPHWNLTLTIFVELFRSVSGEDAAFLAPLLSNMVALRESIVNPVTGIDKEIDVAWRRPVESVIRASVQSFGVGLFLASVPLCGSGDRGVKKGISPSRAWLLPLLKQTIGTIPTELQYFQETILKLAAECEACSEEVGSDSKVTAKVHRTRAMQLWDLFPEFSRKCTDIAAQDGFSKLAPVLAEALKDQSYPTLIKTICVGLQALIDDASESDRKIVAGFASMLLPLLFNQYSVYFAKGKNEHAQVTHDLIARFAGIADHGVVNTLFKQLLKQMLLAMRSDNASKAAEPRVLCALSLALIPNLEAECIDLLYRGIRPLVEKEDDSLLQKSGYKVLESVCQHQPKWVLAHREELSTLMRTSLVTTSVNAKTGRLRCLSSIVAATKDEEKLGKTEIDAMCSEMLGEVMLCTKESNNKARMAAFKLLISIGECMEAVYVRNGAKPNEGTQAFVYIVVAGLAAETPHMRSATLVSLSRVLTHYGKVEELQELLVQVARTSLLLLKEKSREVAKSGIGFAKVCAVRLLKASTGSLLRDIITALLPWANDSKNRFSLKIRVIFERLIKRLGQEVVENCDAIPKDHKILVYIKKQAAYKARKYERGQQGEQDGDAMEVTVPSTGKPKSSKRKRDEDEGMVMDEREGQLDLLDSSALGKVHVDGVQQDSGDESDDSVIQFTKDGKLVLLEDDVDDGEGPGSDSDSDSAIMSDDDDESDVERRQAKQKAKAKAKEQASVAKKPRVAQR